MDHTINQVFLVEVSEFTIKEVPMSKQSKFDPTRFIVNEAADVGALGVQRKTSIAVRKPNKQEFFRSSKSAQLRAPVIELKEERQFYILTPEIAEQVPGDFMLKHLSLCVSRQGNLFLWPLPVVSQDGRAPLGWHESAIAAHKNAIESWTRMAANMSAGEYDIYTATLELEPEWRGLEGDMNYVLEIAFGEQNLIDSMDHPIIRMLQGAP